MGTRWTEEKAADWLRGQLQTDLRDHQVYYLKCLGTGPETDRWLDGRTGEGTVGLASITTFPYTGTRWRAHRLTDGAWAFRCLGDVPGDKWLDGRTADGSVGLAPNPRYPYTGARWQVLPGGGGGHVLRCLGDIAGIGRRFLDGVTANATTALAPHTDIPYTGTHWELRPEKWWVGCNFIPSTAVNQLEMWQRDTFDLTTIRRELGWAHDLGFNAVRVFLHDLVWQSDAAGFVERMRAYLDAAAAQGISTLFVFFDDCWHHPQGGVQPPPIPDTHNSQWVQSPGDAVVADPSGWDRLRQYVQGVISAFGHDARVMGWDLYNEPGGGLGHEITPCLRANASMPLVQQAFMWARDVSPSQPLTSGVFDNHPNCGALRGFQLGAADVISFHRYADPEWHPSVADDVRELRGTRRPLICTEYMARPLNSRFENHLAEFNEAGVGCFNWGLVGGKTQTYVPWSTQPRCEWFHDILRPGGEPYSIREAAIIRCLTGIQPAGAGLEHNAIYLFKCLGDVEGNRWLDGRTAASEVGLAPHTDPPYTGTRWRAVKQMDGVLAFQCLGTIDSPARWLDGRTADASVGLASNVDDMHSGTAWQPCQVEGNVFILRCLGTSQGARLLDGRTYDSTVGLTPHTGIAISGILWELTKVSDG
jgi:hypothetical protein